MASVELQLVAQPFVAANAHRLGGFKVAMPIGIQVDV